jgi:two-component system, chemotaxis family, sensor kinase CheA
LAIIDGMVVRNAEDRFIIPLAHVHESYRPQLRDVQTNVGLGETLMLRGENLPLYRLDHLLGKKSKALAVTEGIAIVVRTQEKPFCVLVDDIVSSQQVVIKKLGNEVSHLKGFSGSAILGDGRPSLILELNELISSQTRRAAA